MQPILFQVCQVVDQIDRAGSKTEQDEPEYRVQQGTKAEQLFIKNQCGEDKHIFDPLPGSHGFDQRFHHDSDDSRKENLGQEDDGWRLFSAESSLFWRIG